MVTDSLMIRLTSDNIFRFYHLQSLISPQHTRQRQVKSWFRMGNLQWLADRSGKWMAIIVGIFSSNECQQQYTIKKVKWSQVHLHIWTYSSKYGGGVDRGGNVHWSALVAGIMNGKCWLPDKERLNDQGGHAQVAMSAWPNISNHLVMIFKDDQRILIYQVMRK